MPGAHTTILLVEDNPDDAELVRIAMDDAGITSTLDVVQDGAQALQYVRKEGAYASMSFSSTDVDMTTIGIEQSVGSDLTVRSTSRPSTPGRLRSSSTRSGRGLEA